MKHAVLFPQIVSVPHGLTYIAAAPVCVNGARCGTVSAALGYGRAEQRVSSSFTSRVTAGFS